MGGAVPKIVKMSKLSTTMMTSRNVVNGVSFKVNGDDNFRNRHEWVLVSKSTVVMTSGIVANGSYRCWLQMVHLEWVRIDGSGGSF